MKCRKKRNELIKRFNAIKFRNEVPLGIGCQVSIQRVRNCFYVMGLYAQRPMVYIHLL